MILTVWLETEGKFKKKKKSKTKKDRWNNSVGAESVLALMERVSQACKVITVRPAEQEHPPGDTAH